MDASNKPIWQRRPWTKKELRLAYEVSEDIFRDVFLKGLDTGRRNYLTPLEVQRIVEKNGLPPNDFNK